MSEIILNYPLKFIPIYKEKIWGGNALNTVFDKNSPYDKTGESWEVSAVKGSESIVENGNAKGRNLRDLCSEFPTEILGERVKKQFNKEFPLLIKLINSQVPLSIQVHPDNEGAKKYNSFGKNEMWYILHSGPESAIYLGFNELESEESIQKAMENGNLLSTIKTYQPEAGDTFNVPAKTVHAIGADILLAEIQQTSDITFRLYDWERLDDAGNPRELHITESLETMNYNPTHGLYLPNNSNPDHTLVSNSYFTTRKIALKGDLNKNTHDFDSFVIYMNLKRKTTIFYASGELQLEKGETVLLPYSLGSYQLEASDSEILEIYV